MTMHLIETRNLCHAYSASAGNVLKDIHFIADEGQRIAVIGQNGAGKSTLFRHFNGILTPTSGEVLIKGEPITKANLSDVRKTVGLVFQNPDDQIFSATVEQDISFGLQNLRLDKNTIAERVDKVCALLDIDNLRHRAPHHLSGGEKKRVAIAGVLAMEPRVIVLDEPTAGLDHQGIKELLAFLNELTKTAGITIIHSTHHVEQIPEIADIVYVMENGEIIGVGTPAEIFEQEELLSRAHLDLPPLSRLITSMQRHGVDIDPAYTYHDVEQSFLKAFGKL